MNNLLIRFEDIKQFVDYDITYSDMYEDLEKKVNYLAELKEKALIRRNKLIPISIFPYDDKISKLPTTLSELFAIEQQKIDSKEN